MKKENLENLGREIGILLKKYDCQKDVSIYFNNKKMTFKESDWLLLDGFNPKDYTEYANEETITMTFEGYFYEVVNVGELPNLLNKFIKLINEFGYYYEMGSAWNLALYEQ